MKVCSVEKCGNNHRVKAGYCNAHYIRWRKYGDPLHLNSKAATRGMSLLERFRHYGWTVTESGCWEWNGTVHHTGYGVITHASVQHRTHRIAYELWVGAIPEGSIVRHKCDNPPCLNPEHLELGTNAENSRDMVLRDRQHHPTGSLHPGAKLNQTIADKMRENYTGVRGQMTRMAKEYNISISTVSAVLAGDRWDGRK